MRTLLIYRDDGPLARALGVRNRLPPSLLTLVAVIPLAVEICADERAVGVVAAVFAWMIVLGGLSRGGDLDRDRFRWAVPPLLRAGEYAALVWLHPAGGFAVVLALTLRHYDLVYRLRYQGTPPPQDLGGGWESRLVVAWVLLATGALPEGFYALAAILGALFAAECVAGWRRFSTADGSAFYDEGEGEAE
ncbi:MAG: hypothetical protein QOG68_2465 [Solirubrobacteraceae bacterium]|nr:hypothetical protein [Solirubrobacteraceae bacterium]